MRIYLSGPMTGIAKLNYPAFEAAAKKLRAKGATVISPHEIVPPGRPPWTWEQHMAADLAALFTCTHIVLLHGWETSRGAQLEKTVAEAIGLPVVYYSVTETS